MDETNENTLTARASRVMIPGLIFALGCGLLFGSLGGAAIAFARGNSLSAILPIIVLPMLIGAAILIFTFRKWPTLQMGEPDTPRTRRLGMVIIGLNVFAVVIAMFFVIPENDGISIQLYSNAPLPTNLALGAAFIWLIGVPSLVYFTRKHNDEVNLEQQRFGETIGFQFFAIAAPVWWLGARGGILPPPDVMILFVAVLIVSVAANLWRKL